jgi:glutamate-5-semialdehyde dehydrogenase
LGVIGIVFESRPEVISQVASLTLKSSNAVIMKGGSESAQTNEVIVGVWRSALERFPAVPADAVQMIRTREEFAELLTLNQDVDLIVPRGSYDLVNYVMRTSQIPVLGHGEGVCHVYVDRAADMQKALAIAFDSKAQYPAVCNAAETLLVDEAIATSFLPEMAKKFSAGKVEMRVCPKSLATLQAAGVEWRTEYSDLIISIRVVSGLDEAIEHINRYGSKHTDSIVTEDASAAERFMNEVDSAGVYHNASTRFADGFRYGLGAEIGISNGKVHARGPVGLEGLTTYKWKLRGHGQVVADYASGKKTFKHKIIQ